MAYELDDTVTIDELLLGVNIAMGLQPIGRCPTLDADAGSSGEINELIAAVRNALEGCLYADRRCRRRSYRLGVAAAPVAAGGAQHRQRGGGDGRAARRVWRRSASPAGTGPAATSALRIPRPGPGLALGRAR